MDVMANTLTRNIGIKPGPGAGGGTRGALGVGAPGSGSDDSKDWPPGWTSEDAAEPQKYRIGMWVALASILMLFISLTSAYIVRGVPALGGGEADWLPIDMPRVLWVNTAILLASSLSIELARRAL